MMDDLIVDKTWFEFRTSHTVELRRSQSETVNIGQMQQWS
jgi:hypothetical protein